MLFLQQLRFIKFAVILRTRCLHLSHLVKQPISIKCPSTKKLLTITTVNLNIL